MSQKYDYDLIAIGSGSAGGAAAFLAKKQGMKVAIVEARKDMLGGHCPNYACVPTKALLHAAQIYRTVKTAGEFGISAENPGFDFKKVVAYRDDVVSQLTGSRIEKNLAQAGIDLIWGEAKFASDHELEVTDPSNRSSKKYSSEHIVIGTGSTEFIPPIPGLQETGYWVSDDAVKLDTLPKSIIVIGGGPIGSEFSQIFSSFDVPVTLLQRADQILQREDREIANYVQADLENRGVKIVLDMDIVEIKKSASGKQVKYKVGGKESDVEAQEILVATGRRANLEPLNLGAARVQTDDKGRVVLNDYLQTSKPNIWAAGDAAGKWQFTHTAAHEGDLIAGNISGGAKKKMNYDVVPRVTFVDPEVASVGMTEDELKAKGIKYRVGKFAIGSLGRALINRDRRGFVKILAAEKDYKILGGHITGEEAGQLIHEIAVAMKAGIPATTIGKTIHAYPTFSEAVAAAAEKFLP